MTAITPTVLGTPKHSGTDNTTYSQAATWTASRLAVMIVAVRGGTIAPNGATPFAGTSLTWALFDSNNWTGTTGVYMAIYVALTGAGGADTFTVTWNTNRTACHMVPIEIDGADLTGTAINALVALSAGNKVSTNSSVTSLAATLPAASQDNDRAFYAIEHAAQETANQNTNWTELDDGNNSAPASTLEVQWRSDQFDTSASCSWTTASPAGGIGFEVKAAAVNATATPTVVIGSATISGDTALAASNATPAALAASAAVNTPTPTLSALPTPSAVVGTTTIGTPSAGSADATATPSAVDATATIGTPSGPATPVPIAVVGVSVMDVPTVIGAATATPSAVAATAAINSPDSVVQVASVLVSTEISLPSLQRDTTQPDAIDVLVTIPTPTVLSLPEDIGMVIAVDIPRPAIRAYQPDPLYRPITQPAEPDNDPYFSAELRQNAAGIPTPSEIIAVALIPTPAVIATEDMTATPAVLQAVVTIGTPSAAQGQAITPSAVAVSTAVNAPTTNAAATAIPGAVAAAVAVNLPAVVIPPSSVPNPLSVLAVVAIGAPTANAAAISSPANISLAAAIGTPSVLIGPPDSSSEPAVSGNEPASFEPAA